MIETIILTNLLYNEPFCRKVLPYLKEEYFRDYKENQLFKIINQYVNEYNALPTKEAMYIELCNSSDLNDDQKKACDDLVQEWQYDASTNLQWLSDQTEQFCQDQAIHLAITKSLEILNNEKLKKERPSVPTLLSNALGVSFDSHLGHDYFDDSEERHEYYHRPENKVRLGVDKLDHITRGGVSNKTLTVLMGGVHTGKTMFMCALSSNNLLDGKNVLYITLEMSEEQISQRIDANLLKMTTDEVQALTKDEFLSAVNRVKRTTVGKLKVHEFPTAQAGSANFKYLLSELKIKQNFVPDIVYIDYMNICCSSRIKAGSKAGLYEYVGAIGQELRGLAVENDIPVVTATQFNREGFKSSDPGMEDVSDSWGSAMIGDFIIGLVRTPELDNIGQMKVIQFKNRYAGTIHDNVFALGVDMDRMRLYDIEEKKQNLVDKHEAKKIANNFYENGGIEDLL